MPQRTVRDSATIGAPAALVYRIIADYRDHHPHIVPSKYFRRITVEEGGVGKGTRTMVEMRVLGRTSLLTHLIYEPEPGRVLQEVDASGFSTTTFTVDPENGGRSARVTIETSFRVRDGILGAMQGWVTGAVLRRIYPLELAQLDRYARSLP
jgi:hypothetical protein